MIEFIEKIIKQLRKDKTGDQEPEPEPKKIEPYFLDRGERLAVIRRQLQLSQKELAEKINVEEQYISSFESGHEKLDCDDLLYGLLTNFYVNPEYLIVGGGEMFLKKSEVKKLVTLCCNNSQIIQMMTYLKYFRHIRFAAVSSFIEFSYKYDSYMINELYEISSKNKLRKKRKKGTVEKRKKGTVKK